MNINGAEGMPLQQLNHELNNGAKIIMYQYCISILVMTFRRSSNCYLIRSGESRVTKGLGFTLLTLIVGWWGIPWGPIYTIGSVVTNFQGGKDVTNEVVMSINQSAMAPDPFVKR